MSRILKTISINLFQNRAINKAITEVAKFDKELTEGLYGLCETLLEDGVLVAKAEVIALGAVDTGELANSIELGAFDRGSGFGIIRATAYYAIFVEYGTGSVGAGSGQHPWAGDAGWEHDTNEHGEAGWLYYGWDMKWHRTAGMPSRPFMYNTMMMLKDTAEREGMRIIGTYIPGGG